MESVLKIIIGGSMKIFMVLVLASLMFYGCAGHNVMIDGQKAKIKTCPEEYSKIQSKYMYPGDLKYCFNKKDNTVLEFTSGESICTVAVLTPDMEKQVASAIYRDGRTLRSVNYFDNMTGKCSRTIEYTPDAKVESVTEYEPESEKEVLFTEYYPDGKVKSVKSGGPGESAKRLEYYPGGAIAEYRIYDNGAPLYSFKYSEDNKPTSYIKHFGHSAKPEGFKGNGLLRRLIFRTISSRPEHAITFNPDGTLKSAEDFKWGGVLDIEEYSSYSADGTVKAYGCVKGPCLKYNKGEAWKCGTENEPCKKKAEELGYTFKPKDLASELKTFPIPSSLNSASQYPTLCDVAPQAFQCM